MLALLLAGALVLAPSAGFAQGAAQQAGLGMGSALTTLLYAPVKLTYAIGGLVVGGLAWCFSGGDNEVAKVVLTPSVLGDYVITPDQLTGKQPIEFFGRDPSYPRQEPVDVAASPQPEYRSSGDDAAW